MGFLSMQKTFVQNYLFEWFQSLNINNNFSEWCKILLKMLQQSILGPLLFNIFVDSIFHFLQEVYICNFTDNYSLYQIEDNSQMVKVFKKKSVLSSYSCGLLINQMILNMEKSKQTSPANLLN